MSRHKIFTAVLGVCLCATVAQAQTTLYATKSSNGFLQTKLTYQLAEDDVLTFDDAHYYIMKADGTQQRGNYASVDSFFLSDPGLGIYRPNYLRNNDFQKETSQYCFARSKQSEHFIVFWEAGFGADPTKAAKAYAFDPDDLLQRAEKTYDVYTGQLGFSQPGNSPTLDTYKIMLFVHYETTWRATGSGVDNKAGTLDVNPDAAKDARTAAHEIAHTFQYIVSCDLGLDHGWRYGFGPNGSGGCAWWESCAQWQAYKVYPQLQFAESWAMYIYRYSHLNLLHEQMRYYNFYVQDYWCQLYGQDFIGRLWKESIRPEDPVETYKRINNLTQDDFCRDMYNYACRAITWDIDAIRQTGRGFSNNFTTKLHDAGDGWVEVDSVNCPQNYGFNVIHLQVPETGTVVSAEFVGEAGAPGYRAYNVDKAGWRYGFVAQTTDGTRHYGDMYSAVEGTAEFTIPEGTSKLWFVVSGAPTEHWRHPWDMGTDDKGNDIHTEASLANDEQWPYKVRFSTPVK